MLLDLLSPSPSLFLPLFPILQFTIYYLPDVTEDQVEEYKAKIGTKFIKTIFRKAEVMNTKHFPVFTLSLSQEVSSEDEDEENAEINKSEAPKVFTSFS